MNSGTIALLETPSEETLDSWSRKGTFPALDVQETQDRLGGTPIQRGMAASRVSEQTTQVDIVGGEIHIERLEAPQPVATEWIADVTDVGVVIAESVTETASELPFPFDLFTAMTSTKAEQVRIDTKALATAWNDGSELQDTWMVAEGDDSETVMRYGDAATPDDANQATTGVGFETAWSGTVVKGVAYQSGYIAVWRDLLPGEFIEFVTDEILPFAEVPEGEPGEQTKLMEESDD